MAWNTITMEMKNITESELKNMYLVKKISINNIAKELNINVNVVKRWLKNLNIPIDSKRNCQKYEFNKNYFDIIDTPDKAYWLGFIWCDGYILSRKKQKSNSIEYSLKVSLSEIDDEHLKNLKKYLNSNHEIKYYNINSGFKTNNREARLLISNVFLGQIYIIILD